MSDFFSLLRLPSYPAVFWFVAPVVVVLAGISKAGFGGGVGTIATPLMALAIPVSEASAIMLPLLIVVDCFSVFHYRSRFQRQTVLLLLSGAVAGIILGACFFNYFIGNERMLKFGIGLLAVLFVAFQCLRGYIFGLLKQGGSNTFTGVLLGAMSGFTSTLVHAGGPPVAVYLLPKKLPRDLFVGTTVIFFAVVNVLKLIPYAALGLFRPAQAGVFLILLPMSFLGVRLGVFLNKRFSEEWFQRIIYTILLLTGVQLMMGKSVIQLLAG